MQISYADALLSLRPGAAWALPDNDLSRMVWSDHVQTRPADDEITAEYNRMLSVGPVPASITRRQFFQQLSAQAIISQNDAISAMKTGVIPVPLQTLINGLPADQQPVAVMLIVGESLFHRSHWLTHAISAAYGWTVTQTDQFFQSASAL